MKQKTLDQKIYFMKTFIERAHIQSFQNGNGKHTLKNPNKRNGQTKPANEKLL